MSGLRSRNKGKRGEQLAALEMRALWPRARSRRAGGETLDENPGRDLIDTYGACVQVKYGQGASVDPWEALAEANAASEEQEIPVALLKKVVPGAKKERPWIAVMPTTEFMLLMANLRYIEQLYELHMAGSSVVRLGQAVKEIFRQTNPETVS